MGTVSYRGVSNAAAQTNGNVGASNVNVTPTAPGSLTSTDRVFIVSACTHSNLICSDSAWKGGSVVQIGTGAVGAGTGMRFLAVWWRDYDGVWTMPTIGLSTSPSNASHSCGAIALSKSTSDAWLDPIFYTEGIDFGTANTTYSATTGSVTTITGGMFVTATALNDNVTMSGASAAVGGVGSVTERIDGGTATGNDVALQAHTFPVTAGSASGTIGFSAVLSGASQGGTLPFQQTTAPAAGTIGSSLPKTTANFRGPTAPLSTLSWDFTSSNPAFDVSLAPNFALSGGHGVFSGLAGLSSNVVISVSPYDLTGSYGEIHVITAGNDPNLFIYPIIVNFADDTFVAWNISAGTAIALDRSGGIVGSVSHVDGDWYRISEAGGTIFYQHGTDGSSWTTIATLSSGGIDLTNVHLSIQALSTATSSEIVTLDDFNPPSSSPVGTIATSVPKTVASFSGTQAPTTGTIASAGQKATAVLAGQQQGSGVIASATQKTNANLIDATGTSGTIASSTPKTSAALNAAQLAKAETLSDDFNSGTVPDPAKWTNGGSTVSGGLLHQANGVALSNDSYDLRGSYAMAELVDVGGGSTSALIIVWTTGFGGAWEGFYFVNGVLYHYSTTDGILGSVTFDPTNHRWLRVSVNGAGTTFTTETSPNGVAWTTLFAHSGGTQFFHDVRLELLGNATTGTGEIAWNSFNVSASPAGALVSTLPKATAALVGTQAQFGALASILPKSSAALAGSMAQPGVLTSTTRKLVAALTSMVNPAGTLGATLQRLAFGGQGADHLGPPSFRVTGTLKILESGFVEDVPEGVVITFRSNVPPGYLVEWNGTSYRVPPILGTLDVGGNIVNEDGGPLLLLAQTDDLNVEDLQWQIDIVIPATVIPPRSKLTLRSWWIQAGSNGDTINFMNALPESDVRDITIF